MSIYELESDKHEITLGYDEMMQSFWLIIHYDYELPESDRYDSEGNDKYIFHNMNDWPGIRMTINDVKKILKLYGEKIPDQILLALYEEAKDIGYFSKLNIKDFNYQDNKNSILNRIKNIIEILKTKNKNTDNDVF